MYIYACVRVCVRKKIYIWYWLLCQMRSRLSPKGDCARGKYDLDDRI